MLKIKLILCPVDFSEFSSTAYRYALSVAEHYQAKLVVQHIVELWRYPSAGFAASASLYDEFCQSLCESGKEQLQEFVKNYAGDGTPAGTRRAPGHGPGLHSVVCSGEKSGRNRHGNPRPARL